jgi:hypothetical protein
VIPDLPSKLRTEGTTFHHDLTWPKGSTWVITSADDHWTDATYLPAIKEH